MEKVSVHCSNVTHGFFCFQNPIQLQDEKTICCWCCADGPISMDVYLERGVFVLGETMKLKIDVENSSNESLQQMKVEVTNVSR